MTADRPQMAERVRLFNAGRLPGQAVKYCRPTAELVNDLWREREQMIDALRDAQMALTDLPSAIREGYANRALTKISIFIEEAKTK